jgi:hypothetical protein
MFIVHRKQQVIPEIHSLVHFLPSQVALEFCSLRNPHIHALAAEMHRTILDIRAIDRKLDVVSGDSALAVGPDTDAAPNGATGLTIPS